MLSVTPSASGWSMNRRVRLAGGQAGVWAMGLPAAVLLSYLPLMAQEVEEIVPDSERKRLALRVPDALRPYWLLARFDRPIGSWLLFWPGAWAIALAGRAADRWDLLLWMGLGA